jgi:hypothetical protein
MFHFERLDDNQRARHTALYDHASNVVGLCLHYFFRALRDLLADAAVDGQDHHRTPMLLMMNIGEEIDGVRILVHEGSAKTCGHHLRASLEAHLGLFYLWQNPVDYQRRCLAYEVSDWHGRRKMFERGDPDSNVGRALRHELRDDPLALTFDMLPVDVRQEIQRIDQRLQTPRLAPIEQEWLRVRAANGNRDPNWYSLWDGPRDLRKLALSLGKGAIYESQYRYWSLGAHAEDALHRYVGRRDGRAVITLVRSPRGLADVCRHALHYTVGTVQEALPLIAPALWERYRQDFNATIREPYEALQAQFAAFGDLG